jgi:hypothetical protein
MPLADMPAPLALAAPQGWLSTMNQQGRQAKPSQTTFIALLLLAVQTQHKKAPARGVTATMDALQRAKRCGTTTHTTVNTPFTTTTTTCMHTRSRLLQLWHASTSCVVVCQASPRLLSDDHPDSRSTCAQSLNYPHCPRTPAHCSSQPTAP